MTNKEILNLVCNNFEALTGTRVEYMRGDGNGSFLHFYTNDNNGLGAYIAAYGYVEAANTLTAMMDGYRLAMTNHI